MARTTPGLADMTATVVRTGTASRPSRQIEEDLRRMGGDLGTSAGADYERHFRLRGWRNFPAGLLELVADLARNASFPAEEFERERRQQIEEPAHRAHHAGLSGERTPSPRAFRRASLRGRSRPRKSRSLSYQREQLEGFYRQNYVAVRTRC